MNHAKLLFILGSFVVACSAKVSRFPLPGESLCSDAMIVEAGGKGLNLAVGAAKLGLDVDGLIAVGDDFFSGLAEPALVRAGLRPSMLRRYNGQTGSGIGFTDARGENCLAVYPGANAQLSAADVHAAGDAIRHAGLVLAQFEIADEPILEAFALARSAGGRTILNPSPFRPVSPEMMALTSILVVNAVEACGVADALGVEVAGGFRTAGPERFERLAACLFAHGVEMLVVTLGADGALAFREGAPAVHQHAFVVETVDTLGAGDAFTAGFATGLLEGLPLEGALRRAAACGAIATRRMGVFEALATREALDLFLAGKS